MRKKKKKDTTYKIIKHPITARLQRYVSKREVVYLRNRDNDLHVFKSDDCEVGL